MPSYAASTHSHPPMLWDVFCKVIDNFGDIGICWRLCANLAARGHRVRLWVDDASALRWMAPQAAAGQWEGVTVRPWADTTNIQLLNSLSPADVWIEGFGCEIATEFIANFAQILRGNDPNAFKAPVWINLEYLSAESYVERSHGLPSPLFDGPAAGATRYFYYPGFTNKTGGLLRENDLAQRQGAFTPDAQTQWLARYGVACIPEARRVSLFCYEPAALSTLLAELATDSRPTQLLVAAGRPHRAVRATAFAGPVHQQLSVHYLPELTQTEYDELLWLCDLNFVRGEDSIVRALWSGRPFVWQIYPQDDFAHHDKLNAFLDMLQAPTSMRQSHLAWNSPHTPKATPLLPLNELPLWETTVQALRQRLLSQEDLVSQLIDFVLKKR